jgi:3D-(3,5/4)-trihydroxycyclohexane-1,2-dione acylhydrolase (decyclizing)
LAGGVFAPRLWSIRRPAPDADELAALVDALRQAERPLVIAGGGVFYAGAGPALAALAAASGLPVAETHAGKGALPADAPGALGAIGVTGSAAANQAARVADVIVGLGTRLQDFTTGSRRLFAADARLFQVNLALHDLAKHGAQPVLGDAGVVVAALAQALRGWTVPPAGPRRPPAGRGTGMVRCARRSIARCRTATCPMTWR